jgi:hypothetical protein
MREFSLLVSDLRVSAQTYVVQTDGLRLFGPCKGCAFKFGLLSFSGT